MWQRACRTDVLPLPVAIRDDPVMVGGSSRPRPMTTLAAPTRCACGRPGASTNRPRCAATSTASGASRSPRSPSSSPTSTPARRSPRDLARQRSTCWPQDLRTGRGLLLVALRPSSAPPGMTRLSFGSNVCPIPTLGSQRGRRRGDRNRLLCSVACT
jgi:hypothetical protein